MPATYPHVDAGQLTALQRDDEHALERLFRDWYQTLIDEAAPPLNGDKAAASRAVETVFVQAWKARREIDTPEKLEAGLHASTQDEASRIQSRREMAHHMDELEGGHTSRARAHLTPTVDEAWDKVLAALHAKHDDAKHRVAAQSRHEAAEQLDEIAEKNLKPSWIIGVVVLIAAVTAGVMWFTRANDEAALARGLISAGVRTTTTNVGQISSVPLSDGSIAKLGPESRLRVPADYGKSMRGLELTGTADFTVAADKDPNFLVRAGPALVTATGTEFAVRYYPAEHNAIVVVREGSVAVGAGDSTRTVAKGGALVVADDSTMREPTTAEMESLTWADGFLTVTDQPVRDVLVAFRRWYGVGLFTSDTSVLNRRVTMKMPVASFDEAVSVLEKAANVTRETQGANIVLRSKRK